MAKDTLKEMRNRKPLRPNPIAPWKLRVGDLRVFCEMAGADTGMGRKRRNVLTIGGKEIRL
jgi:hypothetical protein